MNERFWQLPNDLVSRAHLRGCVPNKSFARWRGKENARQILQDATGKRKKGRDG